MKTELIKEVDLLQLGFFKETDFDKDDPKSEVADLKIETFSKQRGDLKIEITNSYKKKGKIYCFTYQLMELGVIENYIHLEHIKNLEQLKQLDRLLFG